MDTIIPNVTTDDIQRICRKYSVRELGVFGSVSRGESRPGSDVDILIEFEDGAQIGYTKFFELNEELAEISKSSVDLVTKRSLRSPLREHVLGEVKVLYAS
ncbi:MAG TPA: nucleotidyltransferase family protein [Capsulimonadaceae bacterium]|jgi:hypothetical protein